MISTIFYERIFSEHISLAASFQLWIDYCNTNLKHESIKVVLVSSTRVL